MAKAPVARAAPTAKSSCRRARSWPRSPLARTQTPRAGPATRPASIRSSRPSERGAASVIASSWSGSASTRTGPRRRSAASSTSSAPPRPLLSHTTSAARSHARAPSAAAAAARSLGHGLGTIACAASRASPAVSSETGAAAPLAVGAVVTIATGLPACSASAMRSSRARLRCSHRGAAAQSSSTTSSRGPSPRSPAPGFSSGCASARITSAAAARRRSSSHHGICAGVRSGVARPSSRRTAAKSTRRGAGGVALSSHQMAGSAASPASSQGSTKASGPRVSTPGARAGACRSPAPRTATSGEPRGAGRCSGWRTSTRRRGRYRQGPNGAS